MEENTSAVGMKEDESKDPVSWATLFCRLFANISEEVISRFGEEGEAAIKAGVWNFGVARGQNIAQRARANGDPINAYSYLPNYDMGRGDDFSALNTYGDDEVKQLFTQCGFADQWLQDGTERFGKLYCDVIDPAIAKGFSDDLECIHSKRIYEDGVCEFCFRMKKKKEEA